MKANLLEPQIKPAIYSDFRAGDIRHSNADINTYYAVQYGPAASNVKNILV